jgi:hypothetical protein
MGLQDELNALKEQSMKMIPKETAIIMADAMEDLQHADILDHSKRKGDLAPDFELSNAKGETVSSKALLSKGPVIINFYRGNW